MSLSWIEISQKNLKHNIRQFCKILLKDTKFMAVVKSNAYGHGAFAVSKAIEPDVDFFGVANGDEALALRQFGVRKPILVLNYYPAAQVPDLVRHNVALVVYDLWQAREISKAAKKLGKNASVHIKVGTGLSRLGVYSRDAVKFVQTVGKLPNIKMEGLFSHFAASEDDPEYTMIQLGHFRKIIADLENHNVFIPIKHIACTASALAFPQSHFDMVRIGIGTYGMKSYKSVKTKIDLRPALSWKAKILAVKDLPTGAYVGYGKTFKTSRPTKLAILPVGYFEGYDRGFSNNAEVLVGGKPCPVRGRVYMNLLSVDVTDVKGVKAGDEAVLIGTQGRETITADELARRIDTINYEVVTRINPIIPRTIR